ncbi:MAG: fatty acid oxidation complex subunit alpha FadJ [Gammaproteobacteria bacterium]|nr:fatty acid oxidation complex subunit alpha FadJ [Gammaproteobacteria bacterium]
MEKNLTVEINARAIAVITVDVPNEKMNVLNRAFLDEFSAVFDELTNNAAVKGIVIVSGKADSFIAGADVRMLSAVTTAEEGQALSLAGHAIMNKIAESHKPVVVAIHGVCLGGGMELALACHGRVASDDAKTALGLPEVQLGLLPGTGGTQRLPRLIGLIKSLDLMLTGRQVRALEAKRLGLVDAVVPQPVLVEAAMRRVEVLLKPAADKAKMQWFSVKAWRDYILQDTRWGRGKVFAAARLDVKKKTRGNYPAPPKIIDCVEYGYRHGLTKGLVHEAQRFGELTVTSEAKQLINIHFAQTALKKETYAPEGVKAVAITQVGVLGGGLMGGGIGTVSLDKADAEVRLKDINDDGIRRTLVHVHEHFNVKVSKRAMTATDAARQLRRLTATTDYSGFKRVQLVIEAVFEDLALKQQMVRDIEALGNPDIIMATNTSSIPIRDIASVAKRPEQVIGMHYFSPVEKMPLLEIIKHEKTADWVVASCVAFGKRQGKTPIVVQDVPGFYVNRILFPYINESVYLALEGVPIDVIDRAIVQWGMPVGPFKLLDEVGIDVGAKIQKILENAYGERMQGSTAVDKLLADGRKGRKNKKGVYDYSAASRGKQIDASVYTLLGITPTATSSKSMSNADIVERCMLPLLNEAAICLEEGVISSARDGDIATVFGIGFPPFRGGPFRELESRGLAKVVERLKSFEAQYGVRFTPSKELVKKATANQSYFS